MKLSTKIWMLPIGVGVAFALSLLLNLTLGLRSAAELEALRTVDNPYLENILRVNENIERVRSAFQSAVAEDNPTEIIEARGASESVRSALAAMAAIKGPSTDIDGLAAAFEHYELSGRRHALAALADTPDAALSGRMQVELNVLVDHSAAVLQDARNAVEARFVQVAAAQRRGQWISAATALLVLLGLAVSSRLIIRSVWRELQQSHAQLLAAARVAGMAEIATNVLHNVGNVLNSVNVSADLAGTRLRDSKVRGLSRAVDLLDAHHDDLGTYLTTDPRGRALPGYLRELGRTLEAEHAAVADELRSLSRSVDHVKEIIATQQSYAGPHRVVAEVTVDDVLDDALRMNVDALTRHKVEVTRHVAPMPPLALDQHRVLQILVNLIGNAKHAVSGLTDRVPAIDIIAEPVSEAGQPARLRFTVRDNGEGIPPENLTRVFSHGFTTRKNGHGFGLHSCVLAAQEMGGELRVHSDGRGHGATFTLDIPLDPPKGAP